MSARVPDLLVERLAAGALEPSRAAEVRARLEAEEGGLERLDALKADGEALLARVPPRVFAARVEQRARAEAPRVRWGFALGPALAVALAAVVVTPRILTPTDPVEFDGVRAKGSPQLQVHRLGDEAPLPDGAPARSGDLLQVSYTASGAAYGAILSVDGRGTVTWHLPGRGARATRLLPGGGVPLENSYELDDAPSFERFVFVTGSYDFPLDRVEAEVQAWTSGDVEDLALDPSLRATVFTVDKEGAR